MALTQAMLKAMGIESDQRDQIIEAHQEVLADIKRERDELKEKAAKVDDLQRQLEEAADTKTDEWEAKYNAEHEAYEAFKSQVQADKVKAEKAQAYRAMLANAGIDPKRIDTIMRVTDLGKYEIEDGKLKDLESLETAAKTEWADFVLKTKTEGAEPANPPATTTGVPGADPDIAKHMQERNERMFGKIE